MGYGHLNKKRPVYSKRKDSKDMKDISFIMYPTSVTEVEYEEVPEYEFSKLLSDIGGTAGLILGISVSTVLAYLDKFLVYVIPRFISRGDDPSSPRSKQRSTTLTIYE